MTQISFSQFNFRAAGTTSERISLLGITICGFFIPSTFVGTSVSFLVCDTVDGAYVPLKDETGTTIAYTVSASTYTRVRPGDFAGIRHIEMVSNGTEPAAEVVKLAAREMA